MKKSQIEYQLVKYRNYLDTKYEYGKKLGNITREMADMTSSNFIEDNLKFILSEFLDVCESVTPVNGANCLFTDLHQFLIRVRRNCLCPTEELWKMDNKDNERLLSLKLYLSKVLLPLYCNIWTEVAQVEQKESGVKMELHVSMVVGHMSVRRQAMVSKSDSVGHTILYKYSCFREFVSHIPVARMYYDLDLDEVAGWPAWVHAALNGDTLQYKIELFQMLEHIVYQHYCQYLTARGVMNSEGFGKRSGSEENMEDDSKKKEINKHMLEINYFISGAAFRHLLGTLIHKNLSADDIKRILEHLLTSFTLTKQEALHLQLPCAEIDRREISEGSLLRVNSGIFSAVESLELEVLKPIYSDMSLAAVLGNKFLTYAHHEALGHQSYTDLSNSFLDCLEGIKFDVQKGKSGVVCVGELADQLATKFFNYFLGSCDNDWTRLMKRNIKELNNPLARLSFRDQVMTDTVDTILKKEQKTDSMNSEQETESSSSKAAQTK